MDDTFLSQFAFRPELRLHVGVEREFFLIDPSTLLPAPKARRFLFGIADHAWTYELSACQVEHRTAPCPDIDALMRDLRDGQTRGEFLARTMCLHLVGVPVATASMPLDVYPDPRYRRIAASIPEQVLRAACRVAGTHVHIGVADMEEAVRLHDAVVDRLDDLLAEGDLSKGQRMALYAEMAPRWRPPRYGSVAAFRSHAEASGWADSPRNCWHVVRISVHGTVEVRVFGATSDRKKVKRWAKRVLRIAHDAL